MTYLPIVAILLMVLSPILIPLTAGGVHALRWLGARVRRLIAESRPGCHVPVVSDTGDVAPAAE